MAKPLTLAVVGHTNVGKTSLLRTLTRDVNFGQVSPEAGTTRHVEGARLLVDGQPLAELFDTPGLEDAMALLGLLERAPETDERLDGPARIARFLNSHEARQRFEQEAKVLRQLLASDAGLYVIDAREPVLAKYRDELTVLTACGKPLLPVLNFVASTEQQADAWREALARVGLHAWVQFDSVAPTEAGEQRLYESLALLLAPARQAFERLLNDHQHQRLRRRDEARQSLAQLLIDCAACRRAVAGHDQQQAIEALHQAVRQREQSCVEALLRVYAFRPSDASAGELPLLDGRWSDDLFNPETLRQLGIKLGGGVAAGAAAGAGIDLMVGGLTLGLAALAGAVAGGALQTARGYGGRLLGKLKGQRELTVDDAVLRLLALRQSQLVQALEQRGHAATGAVTLSRHDDSQWRQGALPAELRRARAHPAWSTLNPGARPHAEARQQAVEALAAQLLQ